MVNENSLKQLSSFIETVQSQRPVVPCNLQFFLREVQSTTNPKFQVVNIKLTKPDLRNTVYTILTSCNLSTKYLDDIAPPIPKPNGTARFTAQQPHYPFDFDISDIVRVNRKIINVKDSVTLRYVNIDSTG